MGGYFYRGRHRKPTATSRQMAAWAVAGATVAYPLTPAYAEAAEPRWDAIIKCESGGNPKAQNPHSSASGLFQFIDGTWRAYGGGKYAKRAKDATVEQQYEIANRAFAREGYRPWNASKSCWGGKVGKGESKKPKKAEAEAPKPKPEAPKPKPKPKPEAPRYDSKPAPTPTPEPALKPAPEPVGGRQHVVSEGDTLWDIAGPGWVELYERNREVIGNNPNLIFPGQQLNV